MLQFIAQWEHFLQIEKFLFFGHKIGLTCNLHHWNFPPAMSQIAYMAPENFGGGPVDEKCDLYAYGMIMWECLTGREPWKGYLPMQVSILIQCIENVAIIFIFLLKLWCPSQFCCHLMHERIMYKIIHKDYNNVLIPLSVIHICCFRLSWWCQWRRRGHQFRQIAPRSSGDAPDRNGPFTLSNVIHWHVTVVYIMS